MSDLGRNREGALAGGERTPAEEDSRVSRYSLDSNVKSRRLKALMSACVQECLDSLHAASFLSDPAPGLGTSGRVPPRISSSAPHTSFNQHVPSEFERVIESETADHGVRKVGGSLVLLALRADQRPCGVSMRSRAA